LAPQLEDGQHVYEALIPPDEDSLHWEFKCIPDGCVARIPDPVPPEQPFPAPEPIHIAACEAYHGRLSDAESISAQNQLLMQMFYVLETRRAVLSASEREAGVVLGILIKNGIVTVLLAAFNQQDEKDLISSVPVVAPKRNEPNPTVTDMTIGSIGALVLDLFSSGNNKPSSKPADEYREPVTSSGRARFSWMETGIQFRFVSEGAVDATALFRFMCFKTRLSDLIDDDWDFWGPQPPPSQSGLVPQRVESEADPSVSAASSSIVSSASEGKGDRIPAMNKFGWMFKPSLSSADRPVDEELLACVDRFLGSRALSCSSPYFALPLKLCHFYQRHVEDSIRVLHEGDTVIKSTRRCYDSIINEIAVLLYIQNVVPGNEYVVPVRRVFGGSYGIGFEMPLLYLFEIDPRRLFQMIEAVAFVHSLGIVWRDVKPGNFMLDFASDRVVVRRCQLTGRFSLSSSLMSFSCS
jgi:hypothetical protein